jgi:dTDP-4-amino-4,6-dideoxygalactose transaminase
MRIPLVDLKAQYDSMKNEIDSAVHRVMDSASFIMGVEVESFEREFAEFCNVKHAVGVSSGTDAIHLALLACGVRPGDEVITTPFTFTATAEAIVMAGAVPAFVDIDPRTYNLDPRKLEGAITAKTRVILPVHLYGQPADLSPMLEIANRHGIKLIEDAAQAHGAKYGGRTIGGFGEAACFSFYPGKNLGAYGDAGAVVTNSDEIASRIRLLRDHGRRDKYEHLMVGFGNRLDAIQAAILRAKLSHLAEWNRRRQKHAGFYQEALAGKGLDLPYVLPGTEPVWHQFVVRSVRRDAIQAHLKSKGIATGIHYPIPLHLQPAYREGFVDKKLPHAEQAALDVFSLPMYPELGDDQLYEIANEVVQAFAS